MVVPADDVTYQRQTETKLDKEDVIESQQKRPFLQSSQFSFVSWIRVSTRWCVSQELSEIEEVYLNMLPTLPH